MHITLIRPGYGHIIDEYKLNEGRMEPLSLAILAGMIPREHAVVLYDDRIEQIPFDVPTDLVAISVDTFTARRSYDIADAYRQREVPVVFGGLHVSLMPDEAAAHADAIVLGDAEPVWRQIMEDVQRHALRPRYEGMMNIPQSGVLPRRDLFTGKGYIPVSLVQFSRGCPFHCSYCAVARFFHNRHVCRPVEDVVSEIERSELTTVLFTDDNMTIDRERARMLFKRLKALNIRWACQASVDIAKDPEFLGEMAECGCIGQLVGFESTNYASLRWLKKQSNGRDLEVYEQAVRQFRAHGLLTWASFILGADSDTEQTIRETVDFAIGSKFTLGFFHILLPYPGTELYERLEAEQRLRYDGRWWLHPEFRYNTATFLPKNMSPERLTEMTIWANKRFYSLGSIIRRAVEPNTNLGSIFNAAVYGQFNLLVRRTST